MVQQLNGANVIYGAAVTPYPGTGRTYAQEVAQHNVDCGHEMKMLRTYDSGRPLYWTTRSGSSSTIPATPGWETRASWHSMKPDAEDMAAGALDAWATAYLNSIPITGVPRFLTIWHEPESKVRDGVFTASTWKNACYRFGQIVRSVGHPDVTYGPIFASKFTLTNATYHVPAIMASNSTPLFSVSDFVGWNPYHEASSFGTYNPALYTPEYYFDDINAWMNSNAPDIPMAFGETGFVPNPSDVNARADWLNAVATWVETHQLLACCYFDASVSTPWWLRRTAASTALDAASATCWGEKYTRLGNTMRMVTVNVITDGNGYFTYLDPLDFTNVVASANQPQGGTNNVQAISARKSAAKTVTGRATNVAGAVTNATITINLILG
ncbi:hypothetical protein [Actinopolymorpha alba]|uniref:hypothetical protein n=1 Tax=Actinopolymorpha alba TaxID=533267 RepID=UPI000366480D|nr:hypothetical protein [Actinopolymorpha alba]